MHLAARPTLIAAGESQTLEFKASFDKTCIATLVAFANAQGGTVLVSVRDTGVVLVPCSVRARVYTRLSPSCAGTSGTMLR